MKIYYSPSEAGFFIDSKNTPSDAIAISEEEYTSLLEGQRHGYRIVAGPTGVPELVSQSE